MPVDFSSRRKLAKALPPEQQKSRPLPTKAKPKKLAARLGTLAPEELAIVVETGLMEASRLYELSLRGGLDKDSRMYALEQARGKTEEAFLALEAILSRN